MKTHANARLSLKGREQPCSGATGLQAARQRVGRDARPGAKLTRCQSRARGAPAGSARRERRTRGAGAGGRDEKEQAAGGERAEGSLAHCHRWVTWTVAVLTVHEHRRDQRDRDCHARGAGASQHLHGRAAEMQAKCQARACLSVVAGGRKAPAV